MINFKKNIYTRYDQRIVAWMSVYGLLLLRISLGLIFLWFGFLKFFPGISSAEAIAGKTMELLSFGLLKPEFALRLLAVWETAIGIGLITRIYLRETLLLLFIQMLGTLSPLFLFSSETFVIFPWVPSLEGQYIIKNLVLISAGLVIGTTVRGNNAEFRQFSPK